MEFGTGSRFHAWCASLPANVLFNSRNIAGALNIVQITHVEAGITPPNLPQMDALHW